MVSEAIDFVTHKEFDYTVTEFASGKPLEEIKSVSFRKDGKIVHTERRAAIENALPWATPIYKRDLDVSRYNVPFLLHPYISFYTTRGCSSVHSVCGPRL